MSFSFPIGIEATFTTRHVIQLNQLTVDYEKSTGRIHLKNDRYTYPIYVDPDGVTYTIVIKNDELVLLSLEKFYQ